MDVGFVLFTAAVRNEFVFPLNVALDELVYCAVLVLNSGPVIAVCCIFFHCLK